MAPGRQPLSPCGSVPTFFDLEGDTMRANLPDTGSRRGRTALAALLLLSLGLGASSAGCASSAPPADDAPKEAPKEAPARPTKEQVEAWLSEVAVAAAADLEAFPRDSFSHLGDGPLRMTKGFVRDATTLGIDMEKRLLEPFAAALERGERARLFERPTTWGETDEELLAMAKRPRMTHSLDVRLTGDPLQAVFSLEPTDGGGGPEWMFVVKHP